MSENEQSLEENVRAVLSKTIGFLPEEIHAILEFHKTNRNILKFYLNEYGLHLDLHQQAEMAELSRQCDLVALKAAHLEFQAKILENRVTKTILANKRFYIPKQDANLFNKQLQSVQQNILELNNAITKTVEQINNGK